MTTIVSSPEAHADPETWHAAAARLRRENPVCRIEVPDYAPFYAVTKQLCSVQLHEGDVLLMSYLSANRDEDVFPEPMRFDVTRANASEHLPFGTGVHFCPGALFARMELRHFFAELLPRLESVELTGPTSYTAATFVGAPKRIPIRYRVRAA